MYLKVTRQIRRAVADIPFTYGSRWKDTQNDDKIVRNQTLDPLNPWILNPFLPTNWEKNHIFTTKADNLVKSCIRWICDFHPFAFVVPSEARKLSITLRAGSGRNLLFSSCYIDKISRFARNDMLLRLPRNSNLQTRCIFFIFLDIL